MIQQGLVALVEKVWSHSSSQPSFINEMRRSYLPEIKAATAKANGLSSLPFLFCDIHGGKRQHTLPLLTAWNLLRYAARLLDDIEDGDIPLNTDFGQTNLNLSSGLLFTTGMALNELEDYGLDPATAQDIRRKFYQTLLQMCGGQHLDLTRKTPTLEECWQIAEAKSGLFVALICWAGARVATIDCERLDLYWQFGRNLGILDQIKDDLTDLWEVDGKASDLKCSHSWSLPVAYAIVVLPARKRKRLLECLQNAGTCLSSEQVARELVVESGAGIYLTIQSTLYYQQALALLERMCLSASTRVQLTTILDKVRLFI